MTTTTPLPRLWRTARHLQFSQIVWRVRRVASRLVEQRIPRQVIRDDGNLAPVDQLRLPPLTRSIEFDVDRLIEELSRGELTLLNERKSLGGASIEWPTEFGSRDRLWQVTLHYHKWLYALAVHANDSDDARRQANELLHRYLRSWLDQCDNPSQPTRSIPWNAYAIATRLEWWARIIERLSHSATEEDRSLASDLRQSAARQAAYLHDHFEWDLRANHLLRDCVGLAMASFLFEGPAADKWHATAMRIGHQQLREQVLADGGHFERSPMYHLEALEDFCLLEELSSSFAPRKHVLSRSERRQSIDRMIEFARWMQHPDGRTPQLNDCTRRVVAKTLSSEGVAKVKRSAAPGDLSADDRYASRSHRLEAHATGFRHFAESGIACWHTPRWSIFFDCGAVGPDYQPGHAHADTLTVEASLRGERLLIDPGVGSYDSSAERSRDRSTAAHNTVMIDRLDSSEVWHIFRVGRRAYPRNVQVDQQPDATSVSASHNGYDHCPGRPRHFRTVTLDDQSALQVVDRIEGDLEHEITGGWLLEPTWHVELTDSGWLLRSETQSVEVIMGGTAGWPSSDIPLANTATRPSEQSNIATQRLIETSIEPAICHFEFGHTVETQRLTWKYHGSLPLTIETKFIPLPK